MARLKVQKANHLQDLQRQADALNMECNSLSAQVQSHKVCFVPTTTCRSYNIIYRVTMSAVDTYIISLSQEMFDKLRTEDRAVQIKLEGLKELDNLKQGELFVHITACSHGLIH